MPEFQDVIPAGARGFWPNQSLLGDVSDTIIAGQNVTPRGPGYIGAFPGFSTSSGRACPTMMPVADTSGGLDTGSVIYSRGNTYWYIGSGPVFVGSTSLGTASTSLKFRIGLAGTEIVAGIDTPAAPTMAASGAGSMTGTFSAKIAWKRSATGAIGNASAASASVSASNQKLSLTGPVVPAGIDRVRVYVPARGFSTTGPWLFLSEHTVVAGSPLNLPVTVLGPFSNGEWSDGDRGAELAPLDNYSPAALGIIGTHCTSLGSVMVIIGNQGGYVYSFPAKPETYSPERFATLPGPVLGIQPRSADGWCYVWGTNFLAALVLTPDGDVIPRILWSNIGLPNPDAGCLVEDALFAWDGEPVRTTQSGDPDTTFGLAVRDYMRSTGWGSDVVVGYSPEWNAVVYFNGDTALAYYRGMDAWSTPLTGLSGARAAVTVGTQLRCAGSGTTLQLYGGGGGATAFAVTPFRFAGNLMFSKSVRTLRTIASGPVRARMCINLDLTTFYADSTLPGSGAQHGPPIKTNIHNVFSYSMRYDFSGASTVTGTSIDGWMNESHT